MDIKQIFKKVSKWFGIFLIFIVWPVGIYLMIIGASDFHSIGQAMTTVILMGAIFLFLSA